MAQETPAASDHGEQDENGLIAKMTRLLRLD